MINSQNFKFVIDVGVGRIIEEWIHTQHYVYISIASINPEMADIKF